MNTDTALTFIGTATTLLRLGPFTVLTDPNFIHRGQRVYLGYGLVSRRRTEPAMQPSGLPPLDAGLLSHLHADHFDWVATGGQPTVSERVPEHVGVNVPHACLVPTALNHLRYAAPCERPAVSGP